MKMIDSVDKTPCASLSLSRPQTPVRKAPPTVRKNKAPASVLLDAQQGLQALPEIDEAQVAAVRDALAKGQIPLDADALAKAMLAWHRN
ncbi:flagellar biosynthesis anti-sigma factor FlgM [Enterobacterales bacterium CwR94]|nr:flagellar biosynthesis anti-sigma factor FlgM [Enterobacterales bacterium CwR94]